MPHRGAKKEMSKIDEKKMKLIQLVRENEILYDLSHVDHKNAHNEIPLLWRRLHLYLEKLVSLQIYFLFLVTFTNSKIN